MQCKAVLSRWNQDSLSEIVLLHLSGIGKQAIPLRKRFSLDSSCDNPIQFANKTAYLWQQLADSKKVTRYFTPRWWTEKSTVCMATSLVPPHSTKNQCPRKG